MPRIGTLPPLLSLLLLHRLTSPLVRILPDSFCLSPIHVLLWFAEPGVEHKRADFADAPGGSSGAEQSASTASISTKCDKSGDQDAEWLSALLQWGAGLRPALLLRFVAVGDALFAPPSAATSAAATDASTKVSP